MDKLTATARSALMSRVRSKDTSPELLVRSMIHGMGFRFRIHRKDLPGSPDIVLPGRKKVVWVHGCFWHRHPGCKFATVPKSNRRFWNNKFKNNVRRDRNHQSVVKEMGWESLVVWQCELQEPKKLARKLARFLGLRSSPATVGKASMGQMTRLRALSKLGRWGSKWANYG